MKRLMLALVFLSAVAFAQNEPLPTHTFSLTSTAISLPGDRGTFVGTDSGVAISFTDRFDLAETNVLSSDGKLAFFGGGAAYSFPVLSKWINNHSQLSGFRLRIGARAFAGVSRVKDPVSAAVDQHWGGLTQGTFKYSFDAGGNWNLGANVGMARFPGYSKGWIPVVEVGPSFHF